MFVYPFQCMSMIEDMMKEMQGLKDANKQLMDKVSGVSILSYSPLPVFTII